MGQGLETKTGEESHVEIQERGEIFFFYRPKVDKEEAHSPDDVQRMHIVLRAESGENKEEVKQSSESGKEGKKKRSSKKDTAKEETAKEDKGSAEEKAQNQPSTERGEGSEKVNIEEKPLMRFITMGRKSLPDPSKRTRPYWGFVDLVTTNTEDIKKALAEEEYQTATKGTRTKPAARPLAEGVYRILRHESNKKGKSSSSSNMHTHLVYKLELPRHSESEGPQEAMNIEREGSFIIQIKNPEQPVPESQGLQSKRKALFPARLQGLMGSNRFVAADPPDFLNYEGCEFILISASDDIDAELGLDVQAEAVEASKTCSDLVNMFGEISSIKPLMEGTWA